MMNWRPRDNNALCRQHDTPTQCWLNVGPLLLTLSSQSVLVSVLFAPPPPSRPLHLPTSMAGLN